MEGKRKDNWEVEPFSGGCQSRCSSWLEVRYQMNMCKAATFQLHVAVQN